VIRRTLQPIVAATLLLPAFSPVACHQQEQRVVGAAQTAVAKAETAVNKAEDAANKAKAAAAELDQQRAALAAIPLPTKSQYRNVHDPDAWRNPFLKVGAETILLRAEMVDAAPVQAGKKNPPRADAGRRREVEIAPAELAKTLAALPASAWRYGRVAAVAESHEADRKSQAEVRRNMEAAMQKLNDLGVVVEEWPTK
jgi:hypothetical protein